MTQCGSYGLPWQIHAMTDTPADRLKKARIARGYATAADASRAFGWNAVTYASHENGTRGIRADAAERYGRAFGVSAAMLLGLHQQPAKLNEVPVIGKTELGLWRDSRLDGAIKGLSAEHVVVPNIRDSQAVRFAIEVGDESVDRVISKGDFAICIEVDDASQLPLNALVWVTRERGGLVENTIRRVRANDGTRLTLATHSRNSRLDDSLRLPSDDPNDVVIIRGRVVARYTPLDDEIM